MAEEAQESLQNLDRLRSQLESNIATLRKSLQHWQTWDLEYDTLKEKLQHMKGGSPSEILLELGKTFGGALIDEKELKGVFGLDSGSRRTVPQVVKIISDRQDYVKKNVQTIQKQLDLATSKLGNVVGVTEDLQDESGLPMMEIVEELDDDDNVVSSKVTAPSASAPQVLEALEKAGVTEKLASLESSEQEAAATSKPATGAEKPPVSVPSEKPTHLKEQLKEDTTQSKGKKVSFAPDIQVQALEPEPVEESKSRFEPDRRLDTSIAKGWFTTDKNASRIVELDENDFPIGSMPVIPHESPEDAAIRREMLQYSMNEVGAVVAEIDLEEGDFSDDDEFDEYDDEFDDSEEEEEENEYGMTRPIISEEYAQKMAELETKLNASMIENLGPNPDDDEIKEQLAKDAHRLVVKKDSDHDTIMNTKVGETLEKEPEKAKDGSKKGVRFADQLDISSASKTSEEVTTPAPEPTVSETIVERSAATKEPSSKASSKPKRVSRFKSDRSSSSKEEAASSSNPPSERFQSSFKIMPQPMPTRPVPEGPPGKILSSDIVERPSGQSTAPPDDTELDPEFLHREATVAMHKMRNQMIQKQGGFMPSKEEEENPLYEEIDGKLKKVSRFKAARFKSSDS